MKISVFCAALQSGGAERVLSVLSKPFADNYDEVEYIMWYDAPVFYSIDDRIKLVSIEKESKEKCFLKKMIWLRKYIRITQPDIILSFSAPFNMIILTSLLFLNKKIIVCERTDPRSFRWGKYFEILRNLLYKSAQGILTQTKISKDYFQGSLYNKTSIIFNPISMNPEDVGSALTAKKQKIIVTAGRLAVEKRHDLLIIGFSAFWKTHPEYSLVIYGEGNERKKLESLIENLNLCNVVSLPGKTKDLWNKIKIAEIFIMTSKVEGMSNSMIEAMSLGIPTISTKVSGAIDLISNNENGILLDSNNEMEICQALCKISDNKEYARKIGENGTKIYEMLKIERISKEWIDYINAKLLEN